MGRGGERERKGGERRGGEGQREGKGGREKGGERDREREAGREGVGEEYIAQQDTELSALLHFNNIMTTLK